MTTIMRVGSVDVARAVAKGLRAQQAAAKAYTLAARRDSNRYVPMLSGALRGSAGTQSDIYGGRLTYGGGNVPYARAHYYAPGGWRYTTPGTGPKWFDKAKRKYGAKWAQEAQQAARKKM